MRLRALFEKNGFTKGLFALFDWFILLTDVPRGKSNLPHSSKDLTEKFLIVKKMLIDIS